MDIVAIILFTLAPMGVLYAFEVISIKLVDTREEKHRAVSNAKERTLDKTLIKKQQEKIAQLEFQNEQLRDALRNEVSTRQYCFLTPVEMKGFNQCLTKKP